MKKSNLVFVPSFLILILTLLVLFRMEAGFKPVDCEKSPASGSCTHTVLVAKVGERDDTKGQNAHVSSITQVNQKSFSARHFDQSIVHGYQVFYRLYESSNQRVRKELRVRLFDKKDDDIGFFDCGSQAKCPPLITEGSANSKSKLYHLSFYDLKYTPKWIFFLFGIIPVFFLWLYGRYANAQVKKIEYNARVFNESVFGFLSLIFLIRLYFSLAVTTLFIERFSSVWLSLLELWLMPLIVAIYMTDRHVRHKHLKHVKPIQSMSIKLICMLIAMTTLFVLYVGIFTNTETTQISLLYFIYLPFIQILTEINYFFVKAQFFIEFLIIVFTVFFIPTFDYLVHKYRDTKLLHSYGNYIGSVLIVSLVCVVIGFSTLSTDAKHSFLDKFPSAMIILLLLPLLAVIIAKTVDFRRLFSKQKINTNKHKQSQISQKLAVLPRVKFGFAALCFIGLLLLVVFVDSGAVLFLFSGILGALITLITAKNLRKIMVVLSLIVLALPLAYKSYTLSTLQSNVETTESASVHEIGSVCKLPNLDSGDDFKMGKLAGKEQGFLSLTSYTGKKDDYFIVEATEGGKLTDSNECQRIQKTLNDPDHVATITDIDTCVRYCGLSNVKARLFGWVNHNPYDVVLTKSSLGRLEELARVRSYAIPSNITFGDGAFFRYEFVQKGQLDGAMFEHIGGLLFVKTFGLAGIFLVLALYIGFVFVLPKEKVEAKIFIVIMGFVSMYVLLQSLNVFPLVGHNLPLMVVSSFAKDFLPVCFGLVIYLCFFGQKNKR